MRPVLPNKAFDPATELASFATNREPALPNYEITFDPARIDVDAAHAFLAKTYWTPGIPLSVVRKAIENSLCVAVHAGGHQVAFARVVTDRATFAYLSDVYVLEEHRGKGLSRRMLEALFAHPDLQGLRRLMLATRDAHGLYLKFGFQPLANPARMMELNDPDVYARAAQSGAEPLAGADAPRQAGRS